MNAYSTFSLSPFAVFKSLREHRQLVWQLSKREVIGRYRGSIIGMVWSLFNPIFLLAVYTFVFTVVFKVRWGVETNQENFPVMLFTGMVVHGLFAECINRSPGLVLANANYVKKVVFPLEILPWPTLVAALFHTAISVLVLLAAVWLLLGGVPWTVIMLPLVLLPFVISILGVSWFLASAGVYLRDIAQLTGLLTTVLLFMSPVFYPLEALPEQYRPWLLLNPLTFVIEQARQVTVAGNLPDWGGLGLYTLVACLVAWLGFVWFQKTRRGFADVI